MRNDLAQAPELALIAVTHALAASTFYWGSHVSCLEITARQNPLGPCATGIDESVAGRAIAERHQAWSERLPENPATLWEFLEALSMDDLLSLLAHCASLTVNVVQRTGSSLHEDTIAHASALAKAMPHNMNRYWQPTAANYLGRVSKERILEAVRDGVGEDAARRIADLKKAAMALRAEQLLAGTGWLPSIFRYASESGTQAAV